MNEHIEKLINLFSNQLFEINAETDELNRLNKVNLLSDKTISEITRLLKEHRFANEMDEINFFKNANPKVLSPPIQDGLKYNILVNKPISTNEALIAYFKDALKTIQSFFSMNNFHYQYYKNGFQELDHMYFLRSAGPLMIPILDIPSQVKEFCPPMSYLFAKFAAYENVQRYILEEISGLKIYNNNDSLRTSNGDDLEIKWTGETINVIELAYGLWLTGQLSNGNASLNQIVKWLEKNLSVSIGIAQRKFSQISRRKRISITKFIDQMREAILKKIDSDFE